MRGLDRRVAEPLPGRREGDHVGRGVEVGTVGEGLVDHPAPGPGQDPLELRSVAELGRSEQPVGAAERLGQRQRGGHVLAVDGPHRVGDQQLVVGHPERGAGWRRGRPVRRRWRSRCRWWWRRCPRSANCRRVSSLMVTWRQAGSSGGSSVTWAHSARCHGGSWWCRIAGRPARTSATARAAGRFSGIVHRFSTTTRSASASARVDPVVERAPRRASASMARPGTSRSTGPSPATVTTSKPERRAGPRPSWRPRSTRRR